MARSKRKKFSIHSFYCPMCGKKTMELPRSKSAQREVFHRKKLYCPWCKMTLNQIEIKNDEEYFNFKKTFEEGGFKGEVADSLSFIWSPGVGQDYLDEETGGAD